MDEFTDDSHPWILNALLRTCTKLVCHVSSVSAACISNLCIEVCLHVSLTSIGQPPKTPFQAGVAKAEIPKTKEYKDYNFK